VEDAGASLIARHGRKSAAIGVCLGLALIFGGDSLSLAQQKAPRERIDLNRATVQQLESLPGIGAVTAKAIVEFRRKSGQFRRVEDLLAIRGISQAKLERLRPYVTVTYLPAAH
jgi:competence ComEA-like helix-hairpin-helix protein